jgi:lysophospholipase L1-like esterase
VPILAHIPYLARPGFDQEVQALNAAIDRVTAANNLTAGPDLYHLFLAHQATYLLKDGTHPTPDGAKAMNEAWFQLLRPILYK